MTDNSKRTGAAIEARFESPLLAHSGHAGRRQPRQLSGAKLPLQPFTGAADIDPKPAFSGVLTAGNSSRKAGTANNRGPRVEPGPDLLIESFCHDGWSGSPPLFFDGFYAELKCREIGWSARHNCHEFTAWHRCLE
jgi:hypothetical protein